MNRDSASSPPPPSPPMAGLLEPRAEELAQQLHGLAAAGTKVSEAALLSPMVTSLAISTKRLADTQERIAETQERMAAALDRLIKDDGMVKIWSRSAD